MISRRRLLGHVLGLGAATALGAGPAPGAARATRRGPAGDGPFRPQWDSLVAGYRVPTWFRDAKFGIWAHWSAQCVPESGDWYARNMYQQGTEAYEHHLRHYGHPADTGFMEIDRQWKAERWDPGELLDLYRDAGARYFVALASHHDNFDNWASRHHAWNSTRVGPMRDLIGGWARAARERGLRFGVSNHSAHAWHWLQVAYGYDPEGPRRGERYDAWRLGRGGASGRGTWWQGLDPRQLYCGATMPMPDGIGSIAEGKAWHEAHDLVWDEDPPAANPGFVRQWALRCHDLLERYRPDLCYFDDTGLPLGPAGLEATARYYNDSLRAHGEVDVVVNAKNLRPHQLGGVVDDVERGGRPDIEPIPWQTDTCIGDWHYNRARFEQRSYVDAATIVHRLCDVVAKNGNLLLSVPVRGDGTIDGEERRIVQRIGAWNRRFGGALFGSRPWRVAGEGPTQVRGGQFGEQGAAPFTAADIRYTRHGDVLHAITLGAARGTVSLGLLAHLAVERVECEGAPGPLPFTRDGDGVHVALPEALGDDIGVAFTIRGGQLG